MSRMPRIVTNNTFLIRPCCSVFFQLIVQTATALPFQTQVHSSPDCITLTDEHSVKLELDLFI